MSNAVTLQFSDGVEMVLDEAGERSILATALESGVNLVHQCHSGSCGTCIGRIIEGRVKSVPGRMSCLLPSDHASGYRLACLSIPAANTRWELDYPSAMLNGPAPVSVEATVTKLSWVSETVAELTVRVDPADHFTFTAGQFVRMTAPGTGLARCMSMASPPQELPLVRFLIRYLAQGVLSGYLKDQCRVGDVVTMEGPFGSFVHTQQSQADIFVAGGTGLAPVLSMLDSMRLSAGGRGTQHLYFGVTHAADLFYLEELELRQFWMPRLSVTVSISEGLAAGVPRGLTVKSGTVVEMLDQAVPAAGGAAWLCGPPGMITAATSRLTELGYATEQIFSERFNPA